MDSPSYHYRKKRKEKRRWRWAVPAFILLVLLAAGMIAYDIYRGRSVEQVGTIKTTELSYEDNGPKFLVDETTFTMSLPADWQETARKNDQHENSISWQSTKSKEDNRFMTIYIDKIPRAKSYNRLLPLGTIDTGFRHGNVSDNCAAFTEGGSFDPKVALRAKETAAKWEEVTFICDLPKVFDDVVGTSSKEGINIANVTGPQEGKHAYFFIYTDHNALADYEIFIDIVESFKAK